MIMRKTTAIQYLRGKGIVIHEIELLDSIF